MKGSFLKGKTAAITGGSGTIGFAIARALLSPSCYTAGAAKTTTSSQEDVAGVTSLILIGRNIEKLQDAQTKLRQTAVASSHQSVSIFPCDITDEGNVVELFTTFDKQFPGGIDLWINNAGTTAHGATVDLAGSEFERVLKVNVLGSFLCGREALKRMKERGTGGRIINIGSLASHRSRPHSVAYTTSKFALRGLTESMALDARSYQVAVGMIHPGNVVSDLLTPCEREERQQAEGFLEAEDVAQCVLTMASLPYSANVLELTVLPTQQPYLGRG